MDSVQKPTSFPKRTSAKKTLSAERWTITIRKFADNRGEKCDRHVTMVAKFLDNNNRVLRRQRRQRQRERQKQVGLHSKTTTLQVVLSRFVLFLMEVYESIDISGLPERNA